MPVDPQIQALLDKGTGVPATHTLPVDVARAQYEARIALSERRVCYVFPESPLIAAIFAGPATGVLAQTSTPPSAAKGTPTQPAQGMPMGPGASRAMPMMGGQQTGGTPMMGMMQMMMGQGMAGHVEGRIAFLKTELKITDAQMPLWNAVADAIRAAPKDMAQMQCMSSMQSMMEQQSSTLPEKLAAREKTMTAHLEAFRKFKAAVEPLYPALSDEQKKTADQLLLGPMGMMGWE